MKYTAILMLLMLATGTFAQEVIKQDDAEQQAQQEEDETQRIARVDTYELKLKVRVPRVYDNTHSLGYRKYRWQAIIWQMKLTWLRRLGHSRDQLQNFH